MDDVHMPTVPSGSQNNGANGQEAQTFDELVVEKQRLEAEISALSHVLDTHGVNMSTSLTTFDGYPRADLDVPQIRMTRARIIHLTNNYKVIMAKLESSVHEQFAEMQANPQVSQPDSESQFQPQSTVQQIPTRPARPEPIAKGPFAKVDEVISNSPAEAAHLQVGDQIVQFGEVDETNHERLRKLGEVVQQNEGRELVVAVLRDGQPIRLRLVPRSGWGGRGMLGCHIVPLSS